MDKECKDVQDKLEQKHKQEKEKKQLSLEKCEEMQIVGGGKKSRMNMCLDFTLQSPKGAQEQARNPADRPGGASSPLVYLVFLFSGKKQHSGWDSPQLSLQVLCLLGVLQFSLQIISVIFFQILCKH